MNTNEIAINYFEENPKEKDSVLKAWYAFHAGHYRTETLPVHRFSSSQRWSKCSQCGAGHQSQQWDWLMEDGE